MNMKDYEKADLIIEIKELKYLNKRYFKLCFFELIFIVLLLVVIVL